MSVIFLTSFFFSAIECYTEASGKDYRGHVNVTASGKICQNWMSQSPHEHNASWTNYPNTGLGHHNFCRNPTNTFQNGTWCYTTDPDVRWELCDIGERKPICCCNGGKLAVPFYYYYY